MLHQLDHEALQAAALRSELVRDFTAYLNADPENPAALDRTWHAYTATRERLRALGYRTHFAAVPEVPGLPPAFQVSVMRTLAPFAPTA